MVSATATAGTHATVTARTAGGRLGALAGLAFSFFFFMGTAMLDLPHGVSDREMVAWWTDSGHQATTVVSMYSFVLAGLCFLVFLAKLRSRLLTAEGGTGELTSLAVASGAVFVAMLFVAAAARGGIGFAIKSPVGNEVLPGADTLRYYPTIGYAALGAGGLLAAAVTMATTSWLIVRTAVFGRWLAWVGAAAALVIVLANVALSGVMVIPAMLVWTVATSVALGRGDTRTRTTAKADAHDIAAAVSPPSAP
jgi:hypothetical protein